MQNKFNCQGMCKYAVLFLPDSEGSCNGSISFVEVGYPVRSSSICSILGDNFFNIVRNYKLHEFFSSLDDHVVMLTKDLFNDEVDLVNDLGSFFYDDIILGPILLISESPVSHDLFGYSLYECQRIVDTLVSKLNAEVI